MEDWLITKRRELEGLAIFIVAFIILFLLIPPTIPDTTQQKLYDAEKDIHVYQNKLNINFVMGIFVSGLVAILYILIYKKTKEVPKIRSVLSVWKDIPEAERRKLFLPNAYDLILSGSGTELIPTEEESKVIIRLDTKLKTDVRFLLLDVAEDLFLRRDSPIISFTTRQMSIREAISLLYKKTNVTKTFLSSAEKFGFSSADIKRRLVEKELEEKKLLEQGKEEVEENE